MVLNSWDIAGLSERISKRIHLLLWLREYHTLLEPLQFSMALSGRFSEWVRDPP